MKKYLFLTTTALVSATMSQPITAGDLGAALPHQGGVETQAELLFPKELSESQIDELAKGKSIVVDGKEIKAVSTDEVGDAKPVRKRRLKSLLTRLKESKPVQALLDSEGGDATSGTYHITQHDGTTKAFRVTAAGDQPQAPTTENSPAQPVAEPTPPAMEPSVTVAEPHVPIVEPSPPAMEHQAPAMEHQAPAMEHQAPAMEHQAPAMDEAPTQLERHEPAMELTPSELDQRGHGIEHQAPAIEKTTPEIEKNDPVMEQMPSHLEQHQPAKEPTMEPTAPELDRMPPQLGHMEETSPPIEDHAPAMESGPKLP